MTDQLREALALWHADRDLPPKGPVVDITPIVTAAESWAEFPTDAQVEAAWSVLDKGYVTKDMLRDALEAAREVENT